MCPTALSVVRDEPWKLADGDGSDTYPSSSSHTTSSFPLRCGGKNRAAKRSQVPSANSGRDPFAALSQSFSRRVAPTPTSSKLNFSKSLPYRWKPSSPPSG